MENLKVKDIMTKNLVVVEPEDAVVYAAKVLSDHNFNGLPVVNKENVLIGIVTEYDLISQGNAVHLPTLINILGNIGFYKKDKSLIKDDLRNLLTLKVSDIMNTDPLSVEEDAWIQEVADLFAHHHRVNPIPVIDKDKRLVGIVSRYDLIRLFADQRSDKNAVVTPSERLDKKVDTFIDDFEHRFTLVSKTRIRLWPIIYLSFAIIGFIIAFALILRVALK
ncbi:MAG: CBS domain-containing protein [Minisyncoccia bacterium]